MSRAAYLWVEEVEDCNGGSQHPAPDVDGLDSHVTGVGADHVRDAPLEHNAVVRDGQSKSKDGFPSATLTSRDRNNRD